MEGWLRSARKPNAKPRYKDFARAVQQAEAQARLKAEIAILKDSPLDWLKSGPGKELLNLPGWTSPTKPLIQNNNTHLNVLLAPELQQLLAVILKILAPFPDARMAVAQALAAVGEDGTLKKQQLKHLTNQQS